MSSRCLRTRHENPLGFATSLDGLVWTKHEKNPVFTGDRSIPWEQDRGAGCQVEKRGGWYLMFSIGFRDIDHAQIGIARSRAIPTPGTRSIRPRAAFGPSPASSRRPIY